MVVNIGNRALGYLAKIRQLALLHLPLPTPRVHHLVLSRPWALIFLTLGFTLASLLEVRPPSRSRLLLVLLECRIVCGNGIIGIHIGGQIYHRLPGMVLSVLELLAPLPNSSGNNVVAWTGCQIGLVLGMV